LAEVNRGTRVLIEQTDALENAGNVLNLEAANLRCKTLQGQIGLNKASYAWLTAASHVDLSELITAMSVTAKHDPNVSLNVGPGSKAMGYAMQLTEFEIRWAELEAEFKEARLICS